MAEKSEFSLLDKHFADFIVRIDTNPCDELWWAAALASHAAGCGHSCYHLADLFDSEEPSFLHEPPKPLPASPADWAARLKLCETVGEPPAYTPLVLDHAGRLYLHRSWQYEQQVAAGILCRSSSHDEDNERLAAALDHYFPTADQQVDLQRRAARMALMHRFAVISGGPGTGKTATVARILALLLEMAGENKQKIVLAAPTGKAALRLQQSILQAVDKLGLPDEIRKDLPTEVSTIHRLLGVKARNGLFRYNRNNRLVCDVIVVDEASMVDLQLMACLFEALRDDTRVILLGDRNQLASVEAGAVLADICDSADPVTVPVTQLTKSYRFSSDSGIAALSRLINNGESTAAIALLQAGQYQDIRWRQLPAGKVFEDAFKMAVKDGYGRYLQVTTPEEALIELGSFRVLSPIRSGLYGVENLNRLSLQALSLSPGLNDAGHCWLRPVMITGNNYELGLFNGDTGVVMDHEGSAAVWFEKLDGGVRHISVLRLPPVETAFAMTVHKSQGSEFDRVLLILPEQPSEALCRELFYTAVTRARGRLEIWGSEAALYGAIDRCTIRKSGLCGRLAV